MRIQSISVKIEAYEFIYWHSEDLAIPFAITFMMPKADSGRGYSSQYIQSTILSLDHS